MTKLLKSKGEYVLKGLELSNVDSMTLECGDSIEVEVRKVDNRKISDQQRKFIFALCNDIGYYIGEDSEWVRMLVQTYNAKLREIEVESLSSCSMTYANGLIDTIINFCIDNQIPFNMELIESNAYSFDEKQTYAMALQRVCCICGRRAEIHHFDQIGTKGNRNKISHIGLRALPLCRYHHTEIHNSNRDEFIEKYHLTPFVIDKKMEYFIKKGKIRTFNE